MADLIDHRYPAAPARFALIKVTRWDDDPKLGKVPGRWRELGDSVDGQVLLIVQGGQPAMGMLTDKPLSHSVPGVTTDAVAAFNDDGAMVCWKRVGAKPGTEVTFTLPGEG